MAHTQKIISSRLELQQLLEVYRSAGKKIVLTQGSFDMLHIGHGRYLSKAKQAGDILIVGVDSDEKIRHRKGPDRPVVPQNERLEMLSYMDSVDHVILKELDEPKWSLIKAITPDVLIATVGTYAPEQLPKVSKLCGEVTVFPAQATTSTSAKLRRLQIHFAKDFGQKLTPKIETAIRQVLTELEKPTA